MKTLRCASTLILAAIGVGLLLPAQSASPAASLDPVLRWNLALSTLLGKTSGDLPPQVAARAYTMMHAAIAEAVGSVRENEDSGLDGGPGRGVGGR